MGEAAAAGGGTGSWAMQAFQRAADAGGVRLDLHVPVQQKALAVVHAQRAAIADENAWVAFMAGGMLLLLLAAVGKGRPIFNKLIGIVFSFMWASAALKILGRMVEDQGGNAVGWPVEGVVTALLFGAQSVLFAVMGGSGLIDFRLPCGAFASRASHQIGFAHLAATFAATAINVNTKGRFFKLVFPLDLFTSGFILSSALPSGYSKIALHLPILFALSRSWFDVIVLADFEHSFVPVIALIAFHIYSQWAPARDPYRWVAPDLRPDGPQARQRREQRVPKPQPPPMMQETLGGEDGGLQGMDAVKDLVMVDEDGDEAMEFFEVTDEGLKRRNPVGKLVDS